MTQYFIQFCFNLRPWGVMRTSPEVLINKAALNVTPCMENTLAQGQLVQMDKVDQTKTHCMSNNLKKNIQYMSTCNTCRHLLPQSNLSLELWSLPAMMSSICSKEASSMKFTTDVMLKNYLILYFNQHCTQIQIPYVQIHKKIKKKIKINSLKDLYTQYGCGLWLQSFL